MTQNDQSGWSGQVPGAQPSAPYGGGYPQGGASTQQPQSGSWGPISGTQTQSGSPVAQRPASDSGNGLRIAAIVLEAIAILPSLLLLTNGFSVLNAVKNVYEGTEMLAQYVGPLRVSGLCLILAGLISLIASIAAIVMAAMRKKALFWIGLLGLLGALIAVVGSIIYTVQIQQLLSQASSMGESTSSQTGTVAAAMTVLWTLSIFCAIAHLVATLYGRHLRSHASAAVGQDAVGAGQPTGQPWNQNGSQPVNYEVNSQPAYGQPQQSYGSQDTYGQPQQSHGSSGAQQPYGQPQSYGSQQSYDQSGTGEQSYGSQQPYGASEQHPYGQPSAQTPYEQH